MFSSISVIIPALNEEKNLAGAVKEVKDSIKNYFLDYEILIFNDGSRDNTGAVADNLASQDQHIKAIHNPVRSGLGYVYKKGVELACKDYIILLPGDDQYPSSEIDKLFNLVGKADIIIPITVNGYIRPISRQLLSNIYTAIVNLLFNLKVSYYNGIVIHKKTVIKPISIYNNGFAYQTEALVKALRLGHSYLEVGVTIRERQYGRSKAISIKNTLDVFWSTFRLWREIFVKEKDKYKQRDHHGN